VIFDGTPSDLTEKIIEQIYEGESINKEIED
jgi:ABC-type phosphate/phosphonate transport system ATPase subunit